MLLGTGIGEVNTTSAPFNNNGRPGKSGMVTFAPAIVEAVPPVHLQGELRLRSQVRRRAYRWRRALACLAGWTCRRRVPACLAGWTCRRRVPACLAGWTCRRRVPAWAGGTDVSPTRTCVAGGTDVSPTRTCVAGGTDEAAGGGLGKDVSGSSTVRSGSVTSRVIAVGIGVPSGSLRGCAL